MTGRSPLHRRTAPGNLALLAALGAVTVITGPAVGFAQASVEVPFVATSPGTSTPGAAAWVVRVQLGDTSVLEIGRTSVDASTGEVEASALAVNGQGPPRAIADPTSPDAKAAVADWTDETGSLTVTGGYAEARSGERRWTARAGLGQSTGTGIALASQLLTWDQQTQLLGAVQDFNDTVSPLVAQAAGAVAPLLDVLGLPTPRFSPIAPSGLVDVGGGRAMGSTAEAAASRGFAAARADAMAGSLKLFGGFVTVEAISSEAVVERGGNDSSSARSWLAGVQIAGMPAVVDATGVHALGGGPFEALLTPVFDGLLGQLAAAGITVRTIASPSDQSCCSASAIGLEVAFAAQGGPLVVSIGGAEATAPDPLADAGSTAPPPPGEPRPRSGVAVDETAVVRAAPSPAVAPTEPSTPRPAPPRSRIGMIADLGADAVHALRRAYLILLGAGGVATVLYAMAVATRPSRLKRGTS